MKLDLSTATTLAPIDVTRVRTIRFQCKAGSGNPSSAIVEVKQAFDGALNTPSVSLSPVRTLDLSGDTVTKIDVTDVGWLHLVCTTAQSGVTVDVEHITNGGMQGRSLWTEVKLDHTGIRREIGAQADYKAFVLASPVSANTTGAIEIKHSIASGFSAISFDSAATLALDGSTVTEIDAGRAGVLSAACTTAQTGQKVNLYWYLRQEVPEDLEPDQDVIVESRYDFPAPVAGVIQLADNTTYNIVGTVDLYGDRLVGGVNTCLLGTTSENCRLTSTGLSSTAIITSVYSLPMRHLTVQDVDTALDLDGDGSTTALDWYGVNFSGIGTLGTIKDYTNVIMKTCAFFGSSGLTFDGTIGTIGLSDIFMTSGTSAQNMIEIPSTATITRRFRMSDSALVVGSGETGINVSVSATIPDESYILDNVNFSGAGTYLAGVGTSGNTARFTGNKGIDNTAEIANMSMQGNATATTISATGTAVKAAGTTTASSINQKFSHTSNRLTYTGALTRLFSINVDGSAASGDGHQVGVYVAKNGSEINESEIYVTTNASGRAEGIGTNAIVEMATNDYIEIFVENNTATTDVTVTELIVTIQAAS